MSSNDSTQKTLLVAFVLCMVCSIIVSTAAVVLKPDQQRNKELDKKQNILAAAGLVQGNEDKSVDELFEQIEMRIVDLETGEFVTPESETGQLIGDFAAYDQRKTAKDPDLNVTLSGKEDIASIKRRAKFAAVYLVLDESGRLEKLILPVHGYGLWSTLYGFLALESDAQTVVGLGFFEHAETPGLGGEVDNPKWKALWPGKQVFDENGNVVISLIKGSVDKKDPLAAYKVDGLAGATLTSRGVSNLLKYWLGQNAFGPFLTRIKSEGV